MLTISRTISRLLRKHFYSGRKERRKNEITRIVTIMFASTFLFKCLVISENFANLPYIIETFN